MKFAYLIIFLEKFNLLLSKVFLVFVLEFEHAKTRNLSYRFFFAKWSSVIFNERKVYFFGKCIEYDNRFSPLFFPRLLLEVDTYLEYLKPGGVAVLDVGGNFGGWGLALKSRLPGVELVTFEPNEEIFKLLAKNAALYSGWTVVNVGISDEEKMQDFFYIESKSAQGSVFEQNAKLRLFDGKLRKTNVKLMPYIATSVYGRLKHFNLVKIDVEGMEAHVIKGLKGITWDYMYIEATTIGSMRVGCDPHGIIQLVESIFGKVEVIRTQQSSIDTWDLIIKSSRTHTSSS